jgi:hypothetical protein
MAGNFTIRVYEADSAEKHLIKQQPESAVFSIGGSPNTIPSGPATSPFWAKTSRGAKEYGLRPRKLKFRFTPGGEPAGYADCGTLEVVIYSKANYDAAQIGGPATYLGAPGTIVGRVSEDIYPVV